MLNPTHDARGVTELDFPPHPCLRLGVMVWYNYTTASVKFAGLILMGSAGLAYSLGSYEEIPGQQVANPQQNENEVGTMAHIRGRPPVLDRAVNMAVWNKRGFF